MKLKYLNKYTDVNCFISYYKTKRYKVYEICVKKLGNNIGNNFDAFSCLIPQHSTNFFVNINIHFH